MIRRFKNLKYVVAACPCCLADEFVLFKHSISVFWLATRRPTIVSISNFCRIWRRLAREDCLDSKILFVCGFFKVMKLCLKVRRNAVQLSKRLREKGEIVSPATMEKQCRMDLRLTQSQRSSYEAAAALKCQTLSQWSTSNLDAAAQRDIEEARVTRLDEGAFEAFCEMLDEPIPQAALELLSRGEDWM